MQLTCCLAIVLGFLAPCLSDDPKPYEKTLGQTEPVKVKLARPTWGLDLAPDGKSVVYSAPGGVFSITYPDGKPITRFPTDTFIPQQVAAFSNDGKYVIGVCPGIRVWEAGTAKTVLSVDWDWYKMPGSEGPSAISRFSPDRARAFVAGPEDRVTLWDTMSGKEVTRSRRLGQNVSSLAVSPDGKRLALGMRDGFRLWAADKLFEDDAVDLQCAREGEGYRVSFAPDGKQLFVIGPSGIENVKSYDELRIWDIARGRFITTLRVLDANLERVVVLPGGQYGLAVPLSGRGGNVIDLKAGEVLGNMFIACHPLILTPDGKEMLSGTQSQYLYITKVGDVLKLIPEDKPEKKR